MKNRRFRSAAALFLALLLLLACLPLYAAEGCLLAVDPYGDGRETVYALPAGDGCNLFLPADTDRASMRFGKGTGNDIRIGGKKIAASSSASLLKEGGDYVLEAGGRSCTLHVYYSAHLPALYLSTESGSMEKIHADKEYRENGTLRVRKDGREVLCTSVAINGRGNSTWKEECLKRPYTLHFDTKTSLLGMPEAKKWTLLASWKDASLVRDALGWYLGDILGLKYGSEYRYVDLYANGEYLGNYILCESVGIGKDRVDIRDLGKETEKVNPLPLSSYPAASIGEGEVEGALEGLKSRKWIEIPNDPDDITSGYLLELDRGDRYAEEDSGFVTRRGQCVVIKEPAYASKAQVDYIAALWQEAEDALCAPSGYSEKGKHYTEYFDMEPLVSMYILNEFSEDLDAGLTSNYFVLDRDGKFVAAPLWDYDLAFGADVVRVGVNVLDPSVWYANKLCYNYRDYVRTVIRGENPSVFNRLFRREEFRSLTYEKWAEVADAFGGEECQFFLDSLAQTLKASAVMNGARWGGHRHESSYLQTVEDVKYFVRERTKHLNRGFSENAAHIRYDLNGGMGWVIDCTIYQKGDRASVLPFLQNDLVNSEPEGLTFAGWSRERSGEGERLNPGDTIVLDGWTTLYAVWLDGEGKAVTAPEEKDYDAPEGHEKESEKAPETAGKEPEKKEKEGFFHRIFAAIGMFFKDIFRKIASFFAEKG